MKSAVDVLSVNGGRQTITHAVLDLDRLIQGLCRDDLCDWPENFFLRDAHVRADVGENSRLDEIGVRVIAFR